MDGCLFYSAFGGRRGKSQVAQNAGPRFYNPNYILIYFMQTSNNSMPLKRRYSYISLKKREALVQEVLVQSKSLTKTSKRLNIRLSTAKLILKKYKLHGKFFMKKTQQHRIVRTHSPPEFRESQLPQKPAIVGQCANAESDQAIQSPETQNLSEGVGFYNFLVYYPLSYQQGECFRWFIMPGTYPQ